jgi:hypothetical protein
MGIAREASFESSHIQGLGNKKGQEGVFSAGCKLCISNKPVGSNKTTQSGHTSSKGPATGV